MDLDMPETEYEFIKRYEQLRTQSSNESYAYDAVQIGKRSGLITDTFEPVQTEKAMDEHCVRIASGDDFIRLNNWNQQMMVKQSEMIEGNPISNSRKLPAVENLPSNESLLANASSSELLHAITEMKDDSSVGIETINFARRIGRLNTKQRIVFDIVERHLNATINDRNPNQLLLNIQGEPGTGKSEVINTITKLFERKGLSGALARAAYTGIAASAIDGQTLHSLVKMSRNNSNPSRRSLLQVGEKLRNTDYLIIDEISMVSKHIFAKVERALTAARTISTRDKSSTEETNKLFGGINVIIVGDFHQFPPVARKYSALYMPMQAKESTDERIGFQLYRQFNKTIILDEQMRTQDPEWIDFLKHVRHGKCTDKHISMLRSLIVKDENHLDAAEWQDPVLVTPRHCVRRKWNDAALDAHCKRTGNKKYVVIAKDTIQGRKLTMNEKIADLNSKGGYDHQRNNPDSTIYDRAELPNIFEFAIGIDVIVTMNLDAENHLVNGARGTVTGMILHSNEEFDASQDVIQLQEPPVCVFVKLLHGKNIKLDGLEENEVPLQPVQRSYKLQLQNGKQVTVTRTQLPLQIARAFTDYRSQGQTILPIAIDIGRPPSGSISPFNAYVALSRSKGKRSVRLVRDFEDSILQTTPSKDLELEDIRLGKLAETTVKGWYDGSLLVC